MWEVDFWEEVASPCIKINKPHDNNHQQHADQDKDLTMRKGIGSHEIMKAGRPSSVTQDRHRVAIAPKVLYINELIVINRIFNLNNL